MAGYFVLQYEIDNYCIAAEKAIAEFQDSYQQTLLQVLGICQWESTVTCTDLCGIKHVCHVGQMRVHLLTHH